MMTYDARKIPRAFPEPTARALVEDIAAAAFAPGGVEPWLVDIHPTLGTPIASVGTPTYSAAGGYLGGGWMSLSGLNNSVSWDVALSAGTWTIEVLHMKRAFSANTTVQIDGVNVATVPFNAASADNVRTTVTGIAVATSGKHRVTLKITDTAGGTSIDLQHIQLRRTA